jgi:hypothetical protein
MLEYYTIFNNYENQIYILYKILNFFLNLFKKRDYLLHKVLRALIYTIKIMT